MESIKKYLGAEYKVKGRGDVFFDCWGLVYAYYRDVFNISLPSYINDYETVIDAKVARLFIEESKIKWIEIDLVDAVDGDVIVFKIAGLPRHIGILFGKRMLHIVVNSHVVFEEYNTPMWNSRIYGVYRHVERI